MPHPVYAPTSETKKKCAHSIINFCNKLILIKFKFKIETKDSFKCKAYSIFNVYIFF